MRKFQSVQALADQLENDSELVDEIKNDPKVAITKLAEPLRNDVWIYRMIVGGLVLAILVCLVGSIIIAMMKAKDGTALEQPDILLAIASAAVGSIAGLLMPSPRGE